MGPQSHEHKFLRNLDQMNSIGVQANYDDVVTDSDKLIFSTPAYMLDASISQIAIGIEKLINTIINYIQNKTES